MAHSSKETALLAAKQDLLAAYSTVHSCLGRLISLVHNSEPRAVADALGSDLEQHHAQSPPQDPYSRGSTTSQTGYGSHPAQYSDPPNYAHSHPLYPAPPQPQSASNPRTAAPPGPCFMTVTPGAPRQHAHGPVLAPKPRQRKPQQASANQSFASQPAQPLETDDDEDDEDDPEEPVSEDDHSHAHGPTFYNPPRQPATIPTPPGSIPGGKKKRVKRERDPNAPKRPASAYILFQNAVRQEMRAANPTADYKELARQIGDRWKNLSDDAKRPWSEAGKLAMNSWNIQNKEYKISHPEITSPQNQTGAPQAPVPRKRRSRAVEVDAQGHPLPKKRGRPTKAEKDHPMESLVHPSHQNGHQSQPAGGMSLQTINGPLVPISAPVPMTGVQYASQPQHRDEEYTDEGEEEEIEEEEEEEEEEEAPGNHQPAHPSTLPPARANGPPHVSSEMAPHSESDPEDGEEEEGSEPRSPEPNHPVNKMSVQPNGILA
ncbi:hypothetical protein MJO28_014959 [Puccinia striiformis f. sp. tritici]|uniref:HMG box domain-containing protein n=2 Tax=Puccinia striiformis TaxID=27350 RepID=A0A2S4VY61_9BASI|nr:hypothetical protein Pst134EA_027820 [Puccinia striiformis f. sp. tritici]KAH9448509.1 hypothetical protein Pst134EA_027820 [Puccinia striiformis f. sp. tritici]KAI7938039.1 hypothetical protein MJO28_014959 [Puccinia striiformis f. sp. tritici]POW14387.1 hypothetical protein PSHT_07391 [Puccinia striiformis]